MLEATGSDSNDEVRANHGAKSKLAPVSPNTSKLEEILLGYAKMYHLQKTHHRGLLPNGVYSKEVALETLEALINSAYQQGYDDRTLEADHELEDAITATKIEELKLWMGTPAKEVTYEAMQQRIKALKGEK